MISALLWAPLAFGIVGLFLPKKATAWWAVLGAIVTLGIAVGFACDFNSGNSGLQHTVDVAWISGLPIADTSLPISSLRPVVRICSESLTMRIAAIAVTTPIGMLISRIQRHENHCVIIPLSSTPIAPPAPFIELQRAIARWRSGPGANVEVTIASEQAAIIAPPRPWTARAAISVVLFGARPPIRDAPENTISAARNVRR